VFEQHNIDGGKKRVCVRVSTYSLPYSTQHYETRRENG